MTIPDVEKSALPAQVYGITLDSLTKTENVDGVGMLPPASQKNNIWGVITLGERFDARKQINLFNFTVYM